jgi:hypothetical protein
LRIRIRDDTVVRLAGNVTNSVEQIVSCSAFQAAGGVGAYETLNWAFGALVSGDVVEIKFWTCLYAGVVHVVGSVWDRAFSHAFSCQFVGVHALLSTATFAFSCCIISVEIGRTLADTNRIFVILEKLVHDRTVLDASTGCGVCVSV